MRHEKRFVCALTFDSDSFRWGKRILNVIRPGFTLCGLRDVNPVTAPARKISGLKSAQYTPANSIFEGPTTNRLSILFILMEDLSHAHAKRREK